MAGKNALLRFAFMALAICTVQHCLAQDKVYLNTGAVIEGKVTEIAPKQIKMLQKARLNGPVYIYSVNRIDSIIYADGTKEDLKLVTQKRNPKENIPELNTWTFDQLGFAFLSVSQSYERRLKSGLLGFRVPLYIGFIGGGIAGIGIFTPAQGVSPTYEQGGGFSIATGLNPKFYLFKRRKVRAFIGPEATIGYSKSTSYYYDYYYNNNNYNTINRNGTVTFLAKFGLMFNPVDKFNMTIDGGSGIGYIFGGNQPLGLVGLWHIGFAIGTNF